jgi:hypothetical protein
MLIANRLSSPFASHLVAGRLTYEAIHSHALRQAA